MQSDLKEYPAVTRELIEFLDTKWPLLLYNSIQDLNDLKMQQGRREVIDFLSVLLQAQSNRIF